MRLIGVFSFFERFTVRNSCVCQIDNRDKIAKKSHQISEKKARKIAPINIPQNYQIGIADWTKTYIGSNRTCIFRRRCEWIFFSLKNCKKNRTNKHKPQNCQINITHLTKTYIGPHWTSMCRRLFGVWLQFFQNFNKPLFVGVGRWRCGHVAIFSASYFVSIHPNLSIPLSVANE